MKFVLPNALSAIVLLGMLTGLGWLSQTPGAGGFFCPRAAAQELSRQEAAAAVAGAERLSDAFRAAAKQLRPSVVTIASIVEISPQRLQRRGTIDLDEIPEEFRGFFPPELLEQLQRQQPDSAQSDEEELNQPRLPKRQIQAGVGSGVIVTADGYVLTNNHVIEQADALRVELSDGRIFKANVVGTDDKSDVALLKLDVENSKLGQLTPARLGDSAAMEVGDWVIAIGSPFELDQTVTAGIISATNRQTGILSGGYEDFLQTDAAINPGNSGGPLVNLRGEVIGINTAINSRTGTNVGVGFAIPVNMAKRIMEDLQREGQVIRGFLGATLGPVTMENAEELKLPAGMLRGAVIVNTLQGAPADRANLQPGDVVVSIDGRPIRSYAQMRNMIALTPPNSELKFELYRNGQLQQLPVQVGRQTAEKLNQLMEQSRP